jgi:creatinine amidohydrolase
VRSLFWNDLTRTELAAARDAGAVVALPVGAIEQHASHLPVDTDIRLSTAVTTRAAGRARVPVLVGPSLPYGFSPHHLSHPGTISLRLSTYLAVLRDVAASVADNGFRRIAFVNGHGGNNAPLRAAIAEFVTDGLPVTALDYWVPAEAEWKTLLRGVTHRFGHACEFETSLMLAVTAGDTEANRLIAERAAGLPARTIQPWIPPGFPDDPMTAYAAAWPPIFQADDAGYYGDPAAATLATGQAMLEILADRLAGFFAAFAETPLRLGTSRNPDEPSISAPLTSGA